MKPIVTICCSLYAYKGDTERVRFTAKWYGHLCVNAGVYFTLLLANDCSDESFDSVLPFITKPRGFCADIQYFEAEKRKGKAVQLNKLIQPSHSPYVAIVDNDVLLPPNWIPKCLDVLRVPSIGVCGVLLDPKLEHGVFCFTPNGHQYSLPRVIGGACLMWDKKMVGEEGYMWEGGGIYGHEDADFIQRVDKRIGRVAAIKERGIHVFQDGKELPEYEKWKTQAHEKSSSAAIARFKGL